MLVVFAHHIVHVAPPSKVAYLLSELLYLRINVVLKCVGPVPVAREHSVTPKLVLQLLHVAIVVETVGLDI